MKKFTVNVTLQVEGRDVFQADALAMQAVERMAGSPGVAGANLEGAKEVKGNDKV